MESVSGDVTYRVYNLDGCWFFETSCEVCGKAYRYELGDSAFPLEYHRLALSDNAVKRHMLFSMRCPHDLLSRSDIDKAEEVYKSLNEGLPYA